ncbi:MAG: resolvase [Thermoproteota archaeon]|nr:resolvase [Thermoproteota archaeon]
MRNIRRSRGYSYEHTLVQRLNTELWKARRLGGSSIGLPDIIAVNNIEAVLLSIEAKSGTGDALYVPSDQINRCLQIRDMFSFYKSRHAILAFKFMRKKRFKRKGQIVYEQRKLVEYYKIADKLGKITDMTMIKCTYQGKTFFIRGSQCIRLNLPNYTMPFQKVIGTELKNLLPSKSVLKTGRRRTFMSRYSHLT